MLSKLKTDLRKLSSPKKAAASTWFFKTGPGEYAEGDKFLGITLPEMRGVAKKYRELPLPDVIRLLKSPIHEERLTALIILDWQYKKGDNKEKKEIAALYIKNRAYVNNWDLVDSSAPYILGDFLTARSRMPLYRLARSHSLWDRRIAIVSTAAFIKNGDFKDTYKICTMLMNDKHDLIHKACGWMLREAGKKDVITLKKYLDKHASKMPRTMLRYAIEKFPASDRSYFMSKKAAK